MISHLAQRSLFGEVEPRFDPSLARLRRHALGGGAWIDRCPGWVEGEARLFDELAATLPWRASERVMYDRVVAVPRLLAAPPAQERPAVVQAMAQALSRRYGQALEEVTFALYRDGRDSVAMHRDKVLRDAPESLVAIVSLGGPRRFVIRPVEARGRRRTRAFGVGLGDLLVMGGRCQRAFEHGVPKVRDAPPRMALMFRPNRG